MDSIEAQMKIVELESQLTAARRLVSRSINVLEQVKIALEEDNTEEALRIITEATES